MLRIFASDLQRQSVQSVRWTQLIRRATNMTTPTSSKSPSILSGIEDMYQGVTVDVAKEIPFESCKDVSGFSTVLQQSLELWKANGKRGIWLRIPNTYAHLIGSAVDQGFKMHHAQERYMMLTNWLSAKEESRLPGYSTHYIGVGGFVVNHRKEVLVVQERYRTTNHWKLPGGLVEAGEGLVEAAVREVQEETGVSCEFQGIISFREKFSYKWGRDDLYFVALLRPKDHNIEINKCDRELDACVWMPVWEKLAQLEEYIQNSAVNPTNRHIAACVLKVLDSGSGLLTAESVLAYTMESYNTVFSAQNESARNYLLSNVETRNKPFPWYENENSE